MKNAINSKVKIIARPRPPLLNVTERWHGSMADAESTTFEVGENAVATQVIDPAG